MSTESFILICLGVGVMFAWVAIALAIAAELEMTEEWWTPRNPTD